MNEDEGVCNLLMVVNKRIRSCRLECEGRGVESPNRGSTSLFSTSLPVATPFLKIMYNAVLSIKVAKKKGKVCKLYQVFVELFPLIYSPDQMHQKQSCYSE